MKLFPFFFQENWQHSQCLTILKSAIKILKKATRLSHISP